MAFEDLTFSENPGGLAIGIGLITFVVINYLFAKIFRGTKGLSLIVSFIVTIFVVWQLYINEFYGWELSLGVLMYILIGGIILKFMIIPLFRTFKNMRKS